MHQDLGVKEFLFILSILFVAFELDANIANFVYYGTTRILAQIIHTSHIL